MTTRYSVKSYVLENGERYCLLFDSNSDIPMYYPSLFITTQVRNRNMSFSTMEGYLNGLLVLYKFMDERNENIEDRFNLNNFLDSYEIEALKDYCLNSFKKRTISIPSNSIFNLYELQHTDEKASSQTQYIRLTAIAVYVEWLAKHVSQNKSSRDVSFQINRMIEVIKELRPVRKPVSYDDFEKSLDEEQTKLLFELFRPESALNPFSDMGTKVRNRVIFLMLYHLGIRRGELLNIKIEDFDFAKNHLKILRNADDRTDPRKRQPLVKTRDRVLVMKDTLANEIFKYITDFRKRVPGSKKNSFLFIVHKSGPSCGNPLTISGYIKIIEIVRTISPLLHRFLGHLIRHDWNYRLSEQLDNLEKPPSEAEQEKMRSYLMGWKEGSGTAAIYNKRFIREKARQASLQLQANNFRIPKNILETK